MKMTEKVDPVGGGSLLRILLGSNAEENRRLKSKGEEYSEWYSDAMGVIWGSAGTDLSLLSPQPIIECLQV